MALRLIKCIGQGGFGVVDEVLDDSTGIRSARKTFQVNQGPGFPASMVPNVKKRFIREAQVQAAAQHRNIVPVLAVDFASDPPFFLMPLAESSLQKDKEADRNLGGNLMTALMDVMAGLQEIHSMGIYHRDLKPANVLRFSETVSGKRTQYYAIGDFGLMSYHNSTLSTLTTTGMAMGSDYYTAPEVTKELKHASIQSDIFSLGCLIHDFVGIKSRVPCNEINESSAYGALLLSCTRKDTGRRFKSVKSVRDAVAVIGMTAKPTLGKPAEFAALLERPDALSSEEWEALADFIESSIGSSELDAVLMRLTLQRVEELMTAGPETARHIALNYAAWVREKAFIFGDCDPVCDRVVEFCKSPDNNIKAECLMAMLYMGTSHNRWYVERQFFARVAPNAEENLMRRLAVEFRADGEKACRAVSLLEISIGASRQHMHPVLVATLGQIC